jgi:hypothetical protein
MSFGVPFGALEEMLRYLLNVAPADEGKLLSRLRNMQREGFPPGINVGRGVKVSYSVEQLAAILFLHMLVDAGFPPDFGMQLYVVQREEILAVAVQDDRSLDIPNYFPGPATKLIAVRGSVLSPPGASYDERDSRPKVGTVSTLMFIEVFDCLKNLVARPSGVHLIDLAGFLGRGLAHLAAKRFTTLEDARAAMADLQASLTKKSSGR